MGVEQHDGTQARYPYFPSRTRRDDAKSANYYVVWHPETGAPSSLEGSAPVCTKKISKGVRVCTGSDGGLGRVGYRQEKRRAEKIGRQASRSSGETRTRAARRARPDSTRARAGLPLETPPPSRVPTCSTPFVSPARFSPTELSLSPPKLPRVGSPFRADARARPLLVVTCVRCPRGPVVPCGCVCGGSISGTFY